MNYDEFLDKIESFRGSFGSFPLQFCNIEVVNPENGEKMEVLGFYNEDKPEMGTVSDLRITTVESDEFRYDVESLGDLIELLEEIKKESKKDLPLQSLLIRLDSDGDSYKRIEKVCGNDLVNIRTKTVKML